MIGKWWKKNVIDVVHGAAYSGRFAIHDKNTLRLVKGMYFSVTLLAGIWLMSQVNEGGQWHKNAKEAALDMKERYEREQRAKQDPA
ncbi:hypothetical protein GUITHDRAFT_118174 [Guillardia theta CCMP2712]|uniref:Uncharacterized protein n=1 Tax=Guillardia theta (strain CCMP2712) TaxID=905079 RepID=L1IHG3_GUITC|nr:hypothetical protein GUITHDRAFT_118174 [Guillardia theta CCMP2712]EKX35683.1 hypothetical protein GUITHDRAFT_118174 [Guillardia theta CCMP2712]|eukprot:XP_005822663.1 hypothetical protein GUITHDRAFT_118174 [Guillardia theta CCMP2712]